MIDAVTKVLVIVVTLMLGAVILGQVANALTNVLNNINNLPNVVYNICNALVNMTWNAYGVLVITPIIVILAVLLMLFYRRG
jgi:ABC-type Fe3+-siderophore transport system permease subunit